MTYRRAELNTLVPPEGHKLQLNMQIDLWVRAHTVIMTTNPPYRLVCKLNLCIKHPRTALFCKWVCLRDCVFVCAPLHMITVVSIME